MDGADLTGGLFEAMRRAEACLDDMGRLGERWAQAEKVYRVAKARQILIEREENSTPVSIIADLVKGDEKIANLAFERDCARAEYEANREAILFWKKKADVLSEIIRREWQR